VKRAALYLVLALIVGGVVATLVSRDPGYVLIAYDGLSLETSLWFALLVVAAAYGIVRIVLALLERASRTRAALRIARETRRMREAREQTVRGLLALVERDWTAAKNALLGAAPHAELPLVNYLGSAQAAARLGEHEAGASLVRRAAESTPGSAVGVGLIAATIEQSTGHAPQALERLKALHKEAPRSAEVARRLAAALRETGDWQALATLADEVARQKGFGENEARQMQIDAWVGRMNGDAADALNSAWESMPKALRAAPELIEANARTLVRGGRTEEAADFVERMLDKTWSESLVELYGRIARTRPEARLAHAEGWLAARPDDRALLLALGRIASYAERWPKARSYLENALRIGATAAVCAELARLCAAQGDSARAVALQAQALALAGVELPPLDAAQRGA
jgi:HemY protein